MKKRLFAIMLALAMLLVAVPALAEEGEHTHDGESAPTYVDNRDGTHKVIYNCGVVKAKDVSVKHTFNDGKCVCGAEQSVASQPEGQQPATNEPAAQQPAASQPEGQQPATNKPSTQQPTDSQSGGQNPSTNGGGEGGNKETCEHEWGIPIDAENSDSKHYCYMHKKICSKCKEEEWESHVWNRANQKMVKESTCTEPGKDELPCTLCSHVTYVSRELKPHTKDNGKVIKPATCTEKGTMKYNCTVCGNELLEEIPALGHSYGSPSWSWCGFTSASAIFTCTRNCGHSEPETASIVRNGINNCGYYTYTATVQFNGQTYTNTRTDYSCRPDWYYDPCYYNNPCGHWGCGNVCTRYSNCVPCRDYRTTFRVGGYNCLATPKTGDVSVIGMALISLAGAGAAIMGKKRK